RFDQRLDLDRASRQAGSNFELGELLIDGRYLFGAFDLGIDQPVDSCARGFDDYFDVFELGVELHSSRPEEPQAIPPIQIVECSDHVGASLFEELRVVSRYRALEV